jgi:hypothetical protein
LFYDQGKLAIIQADPSMLINEVIDTTLSGCIRVCEVIKIKALRRQFRLTDLGFSIWIQLTENLSVLSQYAVDIPHDLRLILIPLIVISIATTRITKFLIRPSSDGFGAM